MRRAVTIAVVLLAAGRAEAGRTFYGWSYGTELNPERGVELETWMIEEDGKDQGGQGRETRLWWAPTIGITDHFELALPAELAWQLDGGKASTTLDRLGAELRFRPQSPDPLEAGCWTTMFRVAVKRLVTDKAVRGEADAVIAYEHDRVHAELDLGVIGERYFDMPNVAELHPSGGVSIRVTPELRLGAEGYGEVAIRGEANYASWVIAGPSLAWTHGRFWLAGNFGIGVYQIRAAGRLNFAVAF
jgi:hypothetical protein